MSLFDSASLVVTPNGYKEDKLYSIKPTDGSGDLVVTRATTATRVNSDGLIEVTPYNLLQRSEQFENAIWAKIALTVTSNATTAPNGTLTADKLVENTANTTHYLSQVITNQNSLFTYSVYAKKAERDFLFINAFATIPNNFTYVPSAFFNLSNGTIGTVSNCNASIQDAGNGWYRCTIQCTSIFPQTSANVAFYNYTAIANNNNSYLGDGTSGIFIWGGQLVTGTSAKEYFPTTDRLDVPRLDYTNSSCPSILVEPQRTNLLLNSVFNGTGSLPTSWADAFVTGTSAPAASTKSTIGQAYTFTTSATRRVIVQLLNYVSGTTYSFSVYVENVSGSISVAEVLFFNGTGTQTFYKDGVLIPSSTPVVSGSRYTSIFVASATVTQQVRLGNGCTTTTTGSVRLSMPQLEVGSNATSYIPTIASSVTRNADVISKTGISSLIGQTQGTIVLDFELQPNNINGNYLFSLSDGTTSNLIRSEIFILSPTVSQFRTGLTTSGVGQGDNFTTITQLRNKMAISYSLNNFKLFINGVLVYTDITATIPSTSGFYLGNRIGVGNIIGANYKQAILFKTQLTDAECINLTTI